MQCFRARPSKRPRSRNGKSTQEFLVLRRTDPPVPGSHSPAVLEGAGVLLAKAGAAGAQWLRARRKAVLMDHVGLWDARGDARGDACQAGAFGPPIARGPDPSNYHACGPVRTPLGPAGPLGLDLGGGTSCGHRVPLAATLLGGGRPAAALCRAQRALSKDPAAALLLLPAGSREANIVTGARGPRPPARNPVSQNQNGCDRLKLRDGRLRGARSVAELTSTRPSPKLKHSRGCPEPSQDPGHFCLESGEQPPGASLNVEYFKTIS